MELRCDNIDKHTVEEKISLINAIGFFISFPVCEQIEAIDDKLDLVHYILLEQFPSPSSNMMKINYFCQEAVLQILLTYRNGDENIRDVFSDRINKYFYDVLDGEYDIHTIESVVWKKMKSFRNAYVKTSTNDDINRRILRTDLKINALKLLKETLDNTDDDIFAKYSDHLHHLLQKQAKLKRELVSKIELARSLLRESCLTATLTAHNAAKNEDGHLKFSLQWNQFQISIYKRTFNLCTCK